MEVAELHKQWDINDASAKAIHQKIGEMIAVDCQPTSAVENSGLKRSYTRLLPNTAFLVGSILPRR